MLFSASIHVKPYYPSARGFSNQEQNKQAAIVQQSNIKELPKQSEPQLAPEQAVPKKEVNLNGTVCVIGDSITLASTNELRQVFPNCYIDAKVSRHIEGGIDAVKYADAQGALGNIVVLGLGTNGSIGDLNLYKDKMLIMLDYLGPNRQIFWVNICFPPGDTYYDFQFTNNNYLKELSAVYPNLHEVNWHDPVSQHPEWLIADGIHPTEEGSQHYAQIIHDRIVEVLSAQP